MSFEVKAEGVDVQQLLADVYRRIDERKRGALHRRGAALHRRAPARGRAHGRELRADLVDEFRARDAQWNFSFETETIYRSSRGRRRPGARDRAAAAAPGAEAVLEPEPDDRGAVAAVGPQPLLRPPAAQPRARAEPAEPREPGAAQPQPAARGPARGARAAREDARGHGASYRHEARPERTAEPGR